MREVRQISIRDNKSRNKFCIRQNKDYGCRDAYMCHVSCPLWHWHQIILLMDSKNLPFGEAYRLSERVSIEPEDRRKVFRDRIGSKEEYPRERSK